MHTVEFEADITNKVIEIPEKYKELYSKHVKVVVSIDEPSTSYDFSDLAGRLDWSGDELKEQRKLRDEW